MQEQLNDMKSKMSDIEKSVIRIHTKLDKMAENKTDKDIDNENRMTKVEQRTSLISRLMLVGVLGVIGSFFAGVKSKLGM